MVTSVPSRLRYSAHVLVLDVCREWCSALCFSGVDSSIHLIPEKWKQVSPEGTLVNRTPTQFRWHTGAMGRLRRDHSGLTNSSVHGQLQQHFENILYLLFSLKLEEPD